MDNPKIATLGDLHKLFFPFLRDHFAGLAMQAMAWQGRWDRPLADIGASAYQIADAMLAARDGARDAEAEMDALEDRIQEAGYRDAGSA